MIADSPALAACLRGLPNRREEAQVGTVVRGRAAPRAGRGPSSYHRRDRSGKSPLAQKKTPHLSSTFAYGRASPVRTTRRAAGVSALRSSCGISSSQGK